MEYSILKWLNRDLTNPKWMYAKGLGFAVILILSFLLLLLAEAVWMRGVLGVCLIWSSARLYYFLFYVIEKYVDPTFRFAGIGSVIRYWFSKWP